MGKGARLRQKLIADKNGKLTTVSVRDEDPEFAVHPNQQPIPTVISSIDGVSANGWMRMIRDSDADKYLAAWQTSDDDLRRRGWLVPVREVGFERSDAEVEAAAQAWLTDAGGRFGPLLDVDPTSISFVTGSDNLRLDVMHYYLTGSGKTILDEGLANDGGIVLMHVGDGVHYIADGKHRTAAALIKNERIEAHVVELPVGDQN